MKFVVLKSDHLSVTIAVSSVQDAEHVVDTLLKRGVLHHNQRLFFFDSIGRRGELMHDGKKYLRYHLLPQERHENEE